MMDELETLVADTMRCYDQQLPVDAGPPTRADSGTTPGPGHHLRVASPDGWRRRAVLVGAAAATVLIATSAVVVGHVWSTSSGTAATGPATASSAAPAQTSAAAQPDIVWRGTDAHGRPTTYRAKRTTALPSSGNGYDRLEWRGVEFAFLTHISGGCAGGGEYGTGDGTQRSDGMQSCEVAQVQETTLDTILITATEGPGSGVVDPSPATTPVTISGHQAYIGTEGRFTYLWVPANHAVARLGLRTVDDMESLIGSATISTRSSAQCPYTVDPATPVANTRDGSSDTLVPAVPATPTSGSFCQFIGSDLTIGRNITLAAVGNSPPSPIVDRLDALTRTSANCPVTTDTDIRIYFHYRTGPDVQLRAQSTTCQGVDRYTNGDITRYGSSDAIENLPL